MNVHTEQKKDPLTTAFICIMLNQLTLVSARSRCKAVLYVALARFVGTSTFVFHLAML